MRFLTYIFDGFCPIFTCGRRRDRQRKWQWHRSPQVLRFCIHVLLWVVVNPRFLAALAVWAMATAVMSAS